MIRILIVDDHQLLRTGIRNLLTACDDLVVAGEAANGEEALTWLTQDQADVLLMDVSMPGMDGVEACARIHVQYPDIRVIALTMLDQGSFVQLMLRNGASGYVLKDASADELIHAVRTVVRTGRYLDERATELLIGHVTKQAGHARSFIPALTRREREVLKHIADGMSDQEIAQLLYVSPSTIESHRKNLRSKLGARNSAEIVRIAMERGLLGV
jgi:two-component system nitrate/nitrite response regulator NarL